MFLGREVVTEGGGVWRLSGLLTASTLLSAPCSCAPPEHASPGEIKKTAKKKKILVGFL